MNESLLLDFQKSCVSNSTTTHFYENDLEQLIHYVTIGKSDVGIAVINDAEFPSLQSVLNTNGLNMNIIDENVIYVHIGPQHHLYNQDTIYFSDLLSSTYLHLPFDKFSHNRLDMQFGTHTLKEFQKSLTVNNYKLLPYILQTTDSFLLGNKWQIDYLSQFDVKSF